MHTILLVDDSELELKALSSILQKEHYTIVTLTEGSRVLQVLREKKIDLVLLDIVMQQKSGLEILVDIKSRNDVETLPEIMVTGRTDAVNVKAALESGAVDYIRKPFEELEILARVRSALRIKDYQEKLQYLSTHDGLTGLLNHVSTLAAYEALYHEAQKNSVPFAVCMLDIDHFKDINDKYGHLIGDKLLQQLGILIHNHFSVNGFAGRYGGDEFIIVLRNFSKEMAVSSAEAFRKHISGKQWDSIYPGLGVTVSIGISVYSSTRYFEGHQQLIEDADDALYVAKDKGRNLVEFSKEI